jgi:hypothetical protein
MDIEPSEPPPDRPKKVQWGPDVPEIHRRFVDTGLFDGIPQRDLTIGERCFSRFNSTVCMVVGLEGEDIEVEIGEDEDRSPIRRTYKKDDVRDFEGYIRKVMPLIDPMVEIIDIEGTGRGLVRFRKQFTSISPEPPFPGGKEAEVRGPASEIANELMRIQKDPVKAAIGFGAGGSVYYPQDDGMFDPINVREFHDPFNDWQERGFSKEDIDSGMTTIQRGNPLSEEDVYTYSLGGAMKNGIVDRTIISGTGIGLRNRGSVHNPRWERDAHIDTRYIDAMTRVQRLAQIPKEIKNKFGSYEVFITACLIERGEEEIQDWQIYGGLSRDGKALFFKVGDSTSWNPYPIGGNGLKQLVDKA